MTETYTKLKNAKSIPEFFQLLPYTVVESIAAVPVIAFLLSPFLLVVRNCFGFWSYTVLTEEIDEMSHVLVVTAAILCLCKHFSERKSLKMLVRGNTSLVIFIPFVILMVLTSAVHGFTETTLIGSFSRNESLFSYIRYILVYFLCASLIESKTLKMWILRLFLISGLAVGLVTLFDEYVMELPMIEHLYENNISSVFLHFNHYGYYLTLILLVSAGIAAFDKNLPFRILGWFSFVINTIALIRDDTFGCYLAVAFGLVFAQIVHFILHKRTNKAIWCVLGTYIGISFVLSFWYHTVFRNFLTLFFDLGKIISEEDAEHAGSSRWGLWMQSLQFIAERPLTGWGVEGKADELVGCTRPHNEYLQQMLFFGIPAGLLYIWGILEVYLHGLRNKLHLDAPTLVALIAAFGYIVSAFFGNTTYYVSPMFFCILGLGYRVAKK